MGAPTMIILIDYSHKMVIDESQEYIEGAFEDNGVSSMDTSLYNGLSSGSIYGRGNVIGSPVLSNTADSTILQLTELNENLSDSVTDTETRQLVVVDVRGSVTIPDWIMDFFTQFHIKLFEFEDACEMVMKSLYGYDNCTET